LGQDQADPRSHQRHPQARAAAEIAAYLAKSCDAELVLLHVVNPQLNQALDRRRTAVKQSPAIAHLKALRFLLAPLDVQIHEKIRVGNPVEELRAELHEKSSDLVVMGAVDQPNDGVAVMGSTVEVVIAQHHTPYVLLITHRNETAATAGH
jgi:nucleotide-binding universal stress UspA family protein